MFVVPDGKNILGSADKLTPIRTAPPLSSLSLFMPNPPPPYTERVLDVVQNLPLRKDMVYLLLFDYFTLLKSLDSHRGEILILVPRQNHSSEGACAGRCMCVYVCMYVWGGSSEGMGYSHQIMQICTIVYLASWISWTVSCYP